MSSAGWLDSSLRDVRHGWRQVRRAPMLALAVVLSLTVGIGANTAIFSLVDAAILKPLPVPNRQALVIIEWTNARFPEWIRNVNGDFNRRPTGGVQASSIGANLYRRLAREQTAFDVLVGVADPNPAAVALDAAPAEQVSLQHVSSNFFQGLGVPPALGRPFEDNDDRIGAEPVVIVSDRFWRRRLGRSREAIDRIIRINNVPARIVGVAPRGFFGLRAGQWTDIYAPLAVRVALAPRSANEETRGEDDGDWWVRQVARLKPAVPAAVAGAQIASLFRRLAPPEGTAMASVPELITMPGARGFNALNPRDTNALWILTWLVAVLLLIVCANVANLLLSRSVGRQRESAVRLALGASRPRLFRQHLVESGVFAFLGGAAGLALGSVLAQTLHRVFESGRDASSAFDLHVDPRVMAYTSALSAATAILFGVAPAVWAARGDVNEALKAHAKSVAGGRLRLPRLLVSIEIALCLSALSAAGLLGRSLANLKFVDIGFDREHVAYASVNPKQAGYGPEKIGPYVDAVRDALARLPGVVSVSPVEVRLLAGGGNLARVSIPGRATTIERGVVSDADGAFQNRVSEGLLDTLGIPIVAGRGLERRDMRPNGDAVVVDELFVRQFFPDRNPLGQRFGFNAATNTRYEIVGVVHNTRYNSLRAETRPTVYLPLVPGELRGSVHFAIRAGVEPGRLAEPVRKAIASVDPTVPLTEFHTQTGLIDRLLRTERLLSLVSAAFGLVALLLAAIGLAGLLSYVVARRTGEIGVRMALGAGAGDVLRLIMRDSLGIVGLGILMGLPGAYAVAQFSSAALFRLAPLDPFTAGLSLVTLVSIAFIAAWLPAQRAARIDPMAALREE